MKRCLQTLWVLGSLLTTNIWALEAMVEHSWQQQNNQGKLKQYVAIAKGEIDGVKKGQKALFFRPRVLVNEWSGKAIAVEKILIGRGRVSRVGPYSATLQVDLFRKEKLRNGRLEPRVVIMGDWVTLLKKRSPGTIK